MDRMDTQKDGETVDRWSYREMNEWKEGKEGGREGGKREERWWRRDKYMDGKYVTGWMAS